MEDNDLPRLVKQIKDKTIKQLESAVSSCLVFFDQETSSIISISRGDYEQIISGIMEAKNYYLSPEPYMVSNYRFYKIEYDFPF